MKTLCSQWQPGVWNPCWDSSLEKLCQAFTAAAFTCCLFVVLYSSMPVILVQAKLGFISPENLVPELFRHFLFLTVTSCLHPVVNPLYLHPWRCLLIVDVENDTNFSQSVLYLARYSEGVFLYQGRNSVLCSSSVVLRALWCCWAC